MWTRLITSMSSTDRPSRQWPAYSMHWRHSETTRSGVASAAVSGCLKRLLLLSGKRTCRQLECHWKRTGAESDYVVYRTACPIANIVIEIKASRSAFHTQQLKLHATRKRSGVRRKNCCTRMTVHHHQSDHEMCPSCVSVTVSVASSTINWRRVHNWRRHIIVDNTASCSCWMNCQRWPSTRLCTWYFPCLPSHRFHAYHHANVYCRCHSNRLVNMFVSSGVFPSALKQGRQSGPLSKKSW